MFKSSVVIAAVLSLVGPQAIASKARVNTLIGADHLTDLQTVFNYPSHIHLISNQLAFEFGAVGNGAEAGFLRNTPGGGRIMGYFGHQNPTPMTSDVRAAGGYLTQVNPVEVIYGINNYAFGASLSTVDNKRSGTKETTVVGKYGISGDDYAAFIHLHLISAAEKVNGANRDKMNSAPQIYLGAQKKSGEYNFFGSLHIGNSKNEPGAGGSQDIKDTDITLGVEDRTLKTTAADIYYGIKLDLRQRDATGADLNSLQVPVFVGLEYAVTTWGTFRASASQNLLIGSEKDESTGSTDANGIAANTRVAAGIGLKYENLMLDGALTAATSGAINGSTFLSQASVTYLF